MPRLLYFRGEESVRGWMGPHSQSGRFGEDNRLLPLPGIEPATFQLVAQCLNQLCPHVSHSFEYQVYSLIEGVHLRAVMALSV